MNERPPDDEFLEDDEEPQSDTFTPRILDRTVIAVPLLERLKEEKRKLIAGDLTEPELHAVVIDINLEYRGGRAAARDQARKLIKESAAAVGEDKSQHVNEPKSKYSDQYLFARLEGDVLREVVRRDNESQPIETTDDVSAIAHRAIYRIWPDFEIKPLISKSLSTVKADAARISFSALGKDIVWAVMDSGIHRGHPHFAQHKNLVLDPALDHEDFTDTTGPFVDEFGHGTHVAGIIAGELTKEQDEIRAFSRHRDENDQLLFNVEELNAISGMAPECKLLSLKVLDDNGVGNTSNLIAAIAHVQEINGYGRRLKIHGVNMSVGYSFEPEWFACGQSPLCVEIDQLVRSGVVVVVAAGNTGYGPLKIEGRRTAWSAGLDLTINDPGNADLAITVGSTHREMPHVYGVSYFSSKGPTGDGRLKPDLVAPGEKILSCAAGKPRQRAKDRGFECNYVEDSGTSMAAPHVSGVIAAFLSVRREFIGRPEKVKEIFLSTATDLKRDRHFQGYGLVDLMRAIQSV